MENKVLEPVVPYKRPQTLGDSLLRPNISCLPGVGAREPDPCTRNHLHTGQLPIRHTHSLRSGERCHTKEKQKSGDERLSCGSNLLPKALYSCIQFSKPCTVIPALSFSFDALLGSRTGETLVFLGSCGPPRRDLLPNAVLCFVFPSFLLLLIPAPPPPLPLQSRLRPRYQAYRFSAKTRPLYFPGQDQPHQELEPCHSDAALDFRSLLREHALDNWRSPASPKHYRTSTRHHLVFRVECPFPRLRRASSVGTESMPRVEANVAAGEGRQRNQDKGGQAKKADAETKTAGWRMSRRRGRDRRQGELWWEKEAGRTQKRKKTPYPPKKEEALKAKKTTWERRGWQNPKRNKTSRKRRQKEE